MPALVSDTHPVLWYIFNDPQLSAPAISAMDSASTAGDPIYVPSICLVETTYLVEKGRVPATALQRVMAALRNLQAGFRIAPLDLEVASFVGRIPRDLVPDMPDRIIAATALALGLPLVTRDAKIRSSGIQTIS